VALGGDRRPRLAVLRALGLGDLLTVVPALRALARAFPGHRRMLLAPRWLGPLLPLIREDGEPCVEALVDVAGLGADPGLLPPRIDLAVNLHGRGAESHRLLLAAGPRRLLAYRHDEIETEEPMPGWEQDEHETKRWCRLLRHAGIAAEASELEIERPRPALPEWMRGATLLHPGAASAARRWPAERWAAVARAELLAGREVLLTGSRGEVGLARAIAVEAGLDPSRQLAGRTDIRALTALVAAAGAVVCGDTGVAHLATALAVPSVLLFGPTSPSHWGPPGDRGLHRVLWEGRTGDPHGKAPDPGLLEIGVDAVLRALPEARPVAA
jgi:ADP-heptose:LPS heptosyltransferase